MQKIFISIVSVLCLLCIGCDLPPDNSVPSDKTQDVPPKVAKTIDKGDFKVGFASAKKTKNKRAYKKVSTEQTQLMQPLADELNQIFALPYDVYMHYEECGEANAFYDADKKEIIMCYELIDDFYEMFKPDFKKKVDLENAVDGAIAFTFFHELGHALIDVWDLPTTGREEDAADQLSTLLLSDGTPEGKEMVVNGAYSFGLVEDEDEDGELPFWDEHSFNQQRFYNILCLLYGQNPNKNKDLVGKNGLPKERAEICVDEFQRADKAWMILLAPYFKN